MDTKFKKLKELMKSEALSATEIVKYLVQSKKISVSQIQKMYFCFPICKSELQNVKPGMFWYKDDQVSEELIPGKEIKSIVLLVDETNNKIYGDTFFVMNNSWGAIQMYFEHHPEYTMFDRYQFSQVLPHWQKINLARQQLSLQQLLEGEYWTPDPDREHAFLPGYAEDDKRIWGCDPSGSSRLLRAKENHGFLRVKEYDVLY